MEFSTITVIILLIICIVLFIVSFNTSCPEQRVITRIIYTYRPELDIQFSPENFPTKIYDNILNGPNVYQGSPYSQDTGRITLAKP